MLHIANCISDHCFLKSWNNILKCGNKQLRLIWFRPRGDQSNTVLFWLIAETDGRITCSVISPSECSCSCMTQGLILSEPCASLARHARRIPRLAFITVWCLSLKRNELPPVSVPGEAEQMWVIEKFRKGLLALICFPVHVICLILSLHFSWFFF